MMMTREERLRYLRETYADGGGSGSGGGGALIQRRAAALTPASLTALRSMAGRAASSRPEGGISDQAAAIIAQALKGLLRS